MKCGSDAKPLNSGQQGLHKKLKNYWSFQNFLKEEKIYCCPFSMRLRELDRTVMAERSALLSKEQNNDKSGSRRSRRLVAALTSILGVFRVSTNATKQVRNYTQGSLPEEDKQTKDPHRDGTASKLFPFRNEQMLSATNRVDDHYNMEKASFELIYKEEPKNVCDSDIFRGVLVDPKSFSFHDVKLLIRRLQEDGCSEIHANVAESIRQATKDSAYARTIFAELGAIPPLVTCLDSSDSSCRSSALLALLNLAICNNHNKSAIVSAGAVKKIVHLLSSNEIDVQEAAVAALLSISALDANKSVIGASGAVPFFVNMLEKGSFQGRKDALKALYNLSICSQNVHIIIESGVIQHILDMVTQPELAEIALALIGFMADTEIGRKTLNNHKDLIFLLVNVLRWEDFPTCQERGLYVLMLIVHHSWEQRQALINTGAISLLVQLVLLGTELSQQRASRILNYLRDDRSQAKAVSAPMAKGLQQHKDIDSVIPEITAERNIINQMVQQSLQRSMDRLIKRACAQSVSIDQNSSSRMLRNSSRSKSLQF